MATVAHAEPTSEELRAALSDPDALYEIVDGRIVELPSMSTYASKVAIRIFKAIDRLAEPGGLGATLIETMLTLDGVADLRRRPDVAFISVERWPLDRAMSTEGDVEVVPDLAVEVVSPNDRGEEIMRKTLEYLRLGVGQVWVVFPEARQVHVYRSPKRSEIFADGDVLDAGDVVPGLRLVVSDLFSTSLV